MKLFLLSRSKALVAVAGLALFYLQAYQTSTPPNQWVGIAIAVLTALGVHNTPNL